MKKLLSISAVLLAAVLLLTGCNPNADTDDGNGLPGSWVGGEYYKTYNAPYAGISTLTANGSKFTFAVANAGSAASSDKPSAGTFNSVSCTASTTAEYTGFKATVQSSASAYYGFAFNINIVNSKWSYYRIILNDQSFKIDFRNEDGTYLPILDWTQHNAVKVSTKENTVTAYTDKDSSIHIQINGTEVHKIPTAVNKKGQVGFICCIKDTDVTNNTSFTTNFTFKELQK